MAEIGFLPPVAQLTFGIKLRAGIVEAVADFMANRRANRAIIGRV